MKKESYIDMKRHIISVHEKGNLLNCKPKELVRMNLVHEIENCQTCRKCGNDFFNKRELKVHILSVHEGKKAYSDLPNNRAANFIPIIGIKFAARLFGRSEYRCSICKVPFAAIRKLKMHIVSELL